MKELTEEQIKKINDLCPYNQGIFFQPYGIPVHIKEHVIYSRYNTGGYSGGNCWDDSEPRYYSEDKVPDFVALDLVIKELCPDISYLNFKKIIDLIKDNEDTEYEYYGNSTDYKILYLPLSELYELLNKL